MKDVYRHELRFFALHGKAYLVKRFFAGGEPFKKLVLN